MLLALITATDPGSNATTIGYDSNNRLTSLKNPRSLTTTYVRNGVGDVISRSSPDTGTTVFWYDSAGDVTKMVDARGIETDFTYDLARRRLTKTFPASSSENVAFTYDSTTGGNNGKGRLTGLTDNSGSTSFTYNALGQVTDDHRVIGARTYDTLCAYGIRKVFRKSDELSSLKWSDETGFAKSYHQTEGGSHPCLEIS